MVQKLWLVVGFAIGAPTALAAAFLLLWSFTIKTPEASAPQVLATSTQVLEPKLDPIPTLDLNFRIADGRSLLITHYLRRYKSPLLSHANEVVQVSDKYGLDWRLLVAIAQQESNLCKKIPANSYNCWGFGIYGGKVTRFDSFSDAIEVVARGLKRNYVDRGLDTPEKIMAKYTPPSQGSWATGVNQFLEDIE